MAVFLANVGVNASHRRVSPLHPDGTFEIVPIPEKVPWRRPMLRLDGVPVHLDPDFDSTPPTYGDNCRRAGRAFSLRRAKPDDVIFFLARLTNHTAGFYLVGLLEIDDILADVTGDPGNGWWDANAHVRRARATGNWDSFWVFAGTAASGRLDKAIPFTRKEAAKAFGLTWRWPAHRTELQTIGSYTRAVRRIEGAGEEWLRSTCQS